MSDNGSNVKKAFNLEGILTRLESIDIQSDDDDSSSEDNSDIDIDEDSGDDSECSSNPDSTADFASGLGWIGCLSHTSQLGINGALKEDAVVKDVVNQVNKIVAYLRRSSKWLSIYRQKIKEECKCKHKMGHELILPNQTRWNSTFYAIERLAMEQVYCSVKYVIQQIHEGDGNVATAPLLLKKVFHEKVKELSRLLKPLQILTDRLQSDEITSIVVILSTVTAFKGIEKVETKLFKRFKTTLLTNLKERLTPAINNKMFVLASLLDPRQKLKLFTDLTWDDEKLKLDIQKEDFFKDSLTTELIRDDFNDDDNEVQSQSSSQFKSSESNESPNENDLFYLLDSMPSAAPVSSNLLEEYHRYTQEPRENNNTDILEYWRKHEKMFPRLAKLAKRILSVPASSGSVERLFSIAGSLGRARRSKMKISKIEEMVFLREHK